MAIEGVQEWRLEGVLDELRRIDRTMRDRRFAFILGAGASVTSGIPTGQSLARKWLGELHLRLAGDAVPMDDWLRTDPLGIAGLDVEHAAEHYPQIFERRFEGDRESGYAALEAEMEGKTPSLGYVLLAKILHETRHKVVVTTNFDNLVADALAQNAGQAPLVVVHESLAGFVNPQLRRPLVAQIHRGLFLSPKNDPSGVSSLEDAWKSALGSLFKSFTPIVVGYGGNDGSLMGLLDSLPVGSIVGRMVWCYRADSPPPPMAQAVLKKHKGLAVCIEGFDEFMDGLAKALFEKFDVNEIARATEERARSRADQYRTQIEKIQQSQQRASAQEPVVGRVTAGADQGADSWWTWELRTREEPDPGKRDLIFRQGLAQFPDSGELTGSYANFLSDVRGDYDAAEAMYKRAIELNPGDATNVGNYAIFLKLQRRDFDGAERLYKRALELNPDHVNTLSSYALLLEDVRRDLDGAERLYRRAIELAPNDANTVGNFATFLENRRGDLDAAEAMYKRALAIDPRHANNVGNYAIFLKVRRHDDDGAEAMYKRALEIDPNHINTLSSYALFLENQRRDFDGAERLYRRVIELAPDNADAGGNYALFLENVRRDLDAADAQYRRVLAVAPQHANNVGNYALFLETHRGDFDGAERHYEQALAARPDHVQNLGNYALFVERHRHDDDRAEALYKRALQADPRAALITANYADFLAERRRDDAAAETMFRRAVELGPEDVAVAANFALFLARRRGDLDGAAEHYRRAVRLAPDDPNHAANLASVLLMRRGPDDLAEVKTLVARARELAGDKAMQPLAEALLYGSLSAELEQGAPGPDLGRLKGLLARGFERGEWDFGPLFERVLPMVAPERREMYRAIGAAVLGPERVAALGAFDAWRRAQPL